MFFFFFSSRRRHTRYWRDWSSDVCSSDLLATVSVIRLPAVSTLPVRAPCLSTVLALRAERLHLTLPTAQFAFAAALRAFLSVSPFSFGTTHLATTTGGVTVGFAAGAASGRRVNAAVSVSWLVPA